jgi:hypothetical protein
VLLQLKLVFDEQGLQKLRGCEDDAASVDPLHTVAVPSTRRRGHCL